MDNKKIAVILVVIIVIIAAVGAYIVTSDDDSSDSGKDDNGGGSDDIVTPSSMNDAAGSLIKLLDNVNSITVTSPSAADTVCYLGYGSKLVCVSRYCTNDAIPSNVTLCGSYSNPDTDAISTANADVTLVDNSGSKAKTAYDTLKASGMNVVLLYGSDDGIDGIYKNVEIVGYIMSSYVDAKKISDSMKTEVDGLAEITKDASPTNMAITTGLGRLDTDSSGNWTNLDSFDGSGVYVAGKDSTLLQLCDAAASLTCTVSGSGWTSADTDWISISTGTINVLYVLWTNHPAVPNDSAVEQLLAKMKTTAWSNCAAVQLGNVYFIDGTVGSDLGRQSPYTVFNALPVMAVYINPSCFSTTSGGAALTLSDLPQSIDDTNYKTIIGYSANKAVDSTPSSMTDAAGNTIKLLDTVSTITVTSPSAADTVCYLGYGSNLVCVSRYCTNSLIPSTVTLCGSYSNPDTDAISTANADVTLVDNSGSKAKNAYDTLKASGMNVVLLYGSDDGVDGIYKNVEIVGYIMKSYNSAKALADDMRKEVTTLADTTKNATATSIAITTGLSKLAVDADGNWTNLDSFDGSGVYVAGKDSTLLQLCDAAASLTCTVSGSSWFAADTDWISTSTGDITVLYVLWTNKAAVPNATAVEQLLTKMKTTAWSNCAAVQSGSIYFIDGTVGSDLGRQSPYTIYNALPVMAVYINPSCFSATSGGAALTLSDLPQSVDDTNYKTIVGYSENKAS